MANEIKETSIRRIQTQLNQLTTLLPNLQDDGHPAGQLWSEIFQELHQLTRDLDRQEELIDQRIERVITLHNISSRLGSHLDLTTLLNDLAEFSAKLMGAEVSVVKIADERQQSFTTQACYSMLGSPTTSTDQSEELTTNIDIQVIQAKEAVLANDWPNHPLAAATETSTKIKMSAVSSTNKIMAILGVPIILQDEVTGIIEVQSFTNNHAFDENDIHILLLLADHAATAIKNTQLYNRAEILLQETQALQQLSQALASTLQIDEIFDLFFQACTQEIGFEYVVLSMVDKQKDEVKAVAGVGVSQDQLKRSRPLDSPDIMADIVRTGKTEVITGWDDRFDREIFNSEGHADWVRLFLPIVLRRENVGLVEAGFNINTRATIEDSQIRLFRAFIDQTALALDNARRYEASKMAARREALIKEITAKVRASTDLDKVLRTTVKEVGDAIGGKRAYVHLILPTNGETETRE